MDLTLEIDDDGCGRLQFELPADATDEDVAYIESLVPRIESGLLELRDPGTGQVVFSCRPSLTGESLLKTVTRSTVKPRGPKATIADVHKQKVRRVAGLFAALSWESVRSASRQAETEQAQAEKHEGAGLGD